MQILNNLNTIKLSYKAKRTMSGNERFLSDSIRAYPR
jgi:hypothetical protein